MTRRIKLVAAAAVLGALLSGCASAPGSEADPSQPIVVRVGIERIASLAPLYVAEAKGYFEDAGLDVRIENVTSGQDAIPLAASGQLDVIVAGYSAGMFNAIASDLDVTVVGAVNVATGDFETSPSSLLVSRELYDSGEVTEISDLEGRKLAAVGGVGSGGGFLVGQVLDSAGLTLNDVEIVNISIPDVPAALESGAIAAGWTSAPFNTLAIRDGVALTLGVPKEGTTPVGVIFGGGFRDTDAATAFFQAFAHGAQDLADGAIYDEEYIAILAEAIDQDPEVLAGLPLYTVYLPDLEPQVDVLQSMERIWRTAGVLTYSDPLDPDDYIDLSFAEAVDVP